MSVRRCGVGVNCIRLTKGELRSFSYRVMSYSLLLAAAKRLSW